MEKLKELSVFFPAYNEEAHIEETVEKALKVLPKVAAKYEVLVVNDGSKDKTGEVVERLMKKYKELRLITHNPNGGYGEALKTGIYNSKYEWITFTDADGQFDFAEVVNFVDKQQETNADMVIGFYKKRQVSKTKIFTSKVWEYLIWIMFGLKVKDIDCGFKFFNKSVVANVPKLESKRGAFISSEFLIKAQKAGFKIIEIPITHYPRVSGVGTGRNLNVIINSFVDLFKLWIKLR